MNYRSARYIDATRIDCEIEHPIYGWIPYTLDPADTDMTVNNDDLLADMAKNGDVAACVPPTQVELDAIAASHARQERDRLLAASDWTQVADAPVDQAAWATYRQALRDIPLQAGFPNSIVWPTKPE